MYSFLYIYSSFISHFFMQKVLIVYLSKKGTTRYYAHNIGKYLAIKGFLPSVKPVSKVKPEDVNDYPIILLGSWTFGCMLFFQHPGKPWKNLVKKLPSLKSKKVGLFTTYNITPGRIFKSMSKELLLKQATPSVFLKSKGEKLSKENKEDINDWLSITDPSYSTECVCGTHPPQEP